MNTDETDPKRSVTELFRAVAHERRRLLLRCLEEHDHLALADATELVAEREAGTPRRNLSDEQVRDIYLSLYHKHVPKLEEVGLVTYDQQTDSITVDGDIHGVVRTLRAQLADIVERGESQGSGRRRR